MRHRKKLSKGSPTQERCSAPQPPPGDDEAPNGWEEAGEALETAAKVFGGLSVACLALGWLNRAME
jgi:hypothetical protein